MGKFLKLDGTESVFLQDSTYVTGKRLQDINIDTVVEVQETTVQNQAGTGTVAALLLVVRVPNKNSNILYYFNDITIDQFVTYLSDNSITSNLVKYVGCTQFNYAPLANSINILLDETKISNKQYNVDLNTTDFYVNYNNGLTKIFTFAGNLTLAAVAVTAVLAIPLITTPVSADTLTLTFDGVVAPAFTVAGGSPSQATVHTALQAYITAHLPAGYSYTDVLASQVDTFTFVSPIPGTDYAGKVVSFTVTGTTFGTSPGTATFA